MLFLLSRIGKPLYGQQAVVVQALLLLHLHLAAIKGELKFGIADSGTVWNGSKDLMNSVPLLDEVFSKVLDV
jgi:hypothetical protein